VGDTLEPLTSLMKLNLSDNYLVIKFDYLETIIKIKRQFINGAILQFNWIVMI
jgi:hypothetical protein